MTYTPRHAGAVEDATPVGVAKHRTPGDAWSIMQDAKTERDDRQITDAINAYYLSAAACEASAGWCVYPSEAPHPYAG